MSANVSLGDLARIVAMDIIHGDTACVITGGYTSDLLSDVMAHAEEGDLLITIQTHVNTIAVADHVGIPAVLFCGGRPVPDDVVSVAREHGIALCVTGNDQFVASGLVYEVLSSLPG